VPVLPPVPPAGGVVGATGVAVLSVSVVRVVLVRSRSEGLNVLVPPTPRSEGVFSGSESPPPALAIRTMRRRKTIPPAPAAISRLRR
jgi:hypothetical protein